MTDAQVHVRKPVWSRRRFLQTSTLSVTALAGHHLAWSAKTEGEWVKISEHLFVVRGPINVGVIRDGGKAWLIDCGIEGLEARLRTEGIKTIEKILFTHAHRDQLFAAYDLAEKGANIAASVKDTDLLANPRAYWDDDKNLWRVYRSFRPDHLTPVEPIRVDETLTDGQTLQCGPAEIHVFDTPGHTEGSVSYLVEVDGKRVAFSGDCIYDAGQVWDLYSLQKGFSKGGRQIGGYHGFMGDRWRLVESLNRIKAEKADLLVPSHGNLMQDPAGAVDALVKRFEVCYENYVGISALRHYFPQLFTDYKERPGQMPIRPGIKPPDCLRHFGTTWMLVSQSGAAFVMDVGSPATVKQIRGMLARKDIRKVEGLWVTHYHYDHTAGIPEFQKVFDVPCITDRRLADVLIDPTAWRLPCLMAESIHVHQPKEDGASWTWREFTLTSYTFPGQTLYHSALLAEQGDLRMLFVGDSHTMSGIDDYCAFNRNWLGRGVGFQYCLSLIEKLKPTHLFNCHVNDAFTFTPEEIKFMRKNLDRREKLFGELVPWDHANYGTDGSWVRCMPYTQTARPGAHVHIEVVVTNHSTEEKRLACRGVLPALLGGGRTDWVDGKINAKTEGRIQLAMQLPEKAEPGRYVLPVDLKYGLRHLPRFSEALVDVTG